MIGHLIFYAFALVAVGSAVMVVTARNPVRSVLSLVVTFFAMASIWMLLYAEFLSLILLLVYVGAVMTLFLFVVMMLPIDREQKHSGFVRYWPFGLLVMVLLVGMLIVSLSPREFLGLTMASPTLSADYNNTEQLGLLLFTDYLYPFEIAGMLLLAAIIAAIALTHRKTLRRRSQRIAEQVAADPRARLALFKTLSPIQPGDHHDHTH
jgi:NADH-quinone oxidoreductase subunit J